MYFCTAKVSLAGDMRNELYRDRYNPVSLPEVELIEFMHGDGAITEVEPFVRVPQTQREERERLLILYGTSAVTTLWGAKGVGALEAGGVTLKQGVEWLNPITNQLEVTEGTPETDDNPTIPLKKK